MKAKNVLCVLFTLFAAGSASAGAGVSDGKAVETKITITKKDAAELNAHFGSRNRATLGAAKLGGYQSPALVGKVLPGTFVADDLHDRVRVRHGLEPLNVPCVNQFENVTICPAGSPQVGNSRGVFKGVVLESGLVAYPRMVINRPVCLSHYGTPSVCFSDESIEKMAAIQQGKAREASGDFATFDEIQKIVPAGWAVQFSPKN